MLSKIAISVKINTLLETREQIPCPYYLLNLVIPGASAIYLEYVQRFAFIHAYQENFLVHCRPSL